MEPFVSISRFSSLFITEPWKMASKKLFHNQVLEVETELHPMELLEHCLCIEEKLGRQRSGTEAYEDRLIDIDILLYGPQVINHANLVIPQKNLDSRAFALLPLLELNPNLVHPQTQVAFKDNLVDLQDEVASITKLI